MSMETYLDYVGGGGGGFLAGLGDVGRPNLNIAWALRWMTGEGAKQKRACILGSPVLIMGVI